MPAWLSVHILRHAGKASCRVPPVTSTLGIRITRMAISSLLERVERIQSEDLRRYLGVLLAAGAIILVSVFGAYVVFFSRHQFRIDAEAWGQFGDFIGGTANPLLAFLTLTAFILTLLLQNKQLQVSVAALDDSRRELELTRAELERSARAQEQSEKALRAQAEASARNTDLSTLNFLLGAYREELQSFKGMAFIGQDPRAQRPGELRHRLAVLETITDTLFSEVTKRNEPEPKSNP